MLTAFIVMPMELVSTEEKMLCETSNLTADPDADPVPGPAPICRNVNDPQSTRGYACRRVGRSGWP